MSLEMEFVVGGAGIVFCDAGGSSEEDNAVLEVVELVVGGDGSMEGRGRVMVEG